MAPNSLIDGSGVEEDPILVDDGFIEEIWKDLGGRISQEAIREVVNEIAAEFQDATVTSFIPILLQREARARVELLLDEAEIS
jgi:hypothetical protein